MSVSPLLLRRVFPGYEFYWGGEVIELEGGGAPDSAALFDLVHHVVSVDVFAEAGLQLVDGVLVVVLDCGEHGREICGAQLFVSLLAIS